eukprot:1062140-Heterocapsa_arctica.AAC.1
MGRERMGGAGRGGERNVAKAGSQNRSHDLGHKNAWPKHGQKPGHTISCRKYALDTRAHRGSGLGIQIDREHAPGRVRHELGQ